MKHSEGSRRAVPDYHGVLSYNQTTAFCKQIATYEDIITGDWMTGFDINDKTAVTKDR